VQFISAPFSLYAKVATSEAKAVLSKKNEYLEIAAING
jgi:hypothetical protein